MNLLSIIKRKREGMNRSNSMQAPPNRAIKVSIILSSLQPEKIKEEEPNQLFNSLFTDVVEETGKKKWAALQDRLGKTYKHDKNKFTLSSLDCFLRIMGI